ncbi:unnamed protein product [Caenorhabditis angaria]|uniref:WW domain-containing protein n=1 Tax=Caenorhabditis angaria TaxID=860376 RepID=A0A9P1N2L8_9PELO|nr:unnamed protein product [Caenorhabditis angaria]
MLPNGFNYLSTVLAAQQQLLFAQRGVVPINAVPGLPIGIPLPASTPTRPSPMLVPPGMGAEDSATTDSPDSEWTEHKHTDGRIYYHNRVTKQSSWVKPDALKSADEKSQPVWREYQTEDGKSYYYNLATKKTTWTKPEGEEIAKFDQKSSSSAAASSSTPAEKSTAETSEKPAESKMKQEESEMEKAMKATLASMINVPLPAEKSGKNEEILATNDEGELKKRQAERFRDLLRDKYNDGKISTTCNWDQAVKFIQNDPRFRILTKVSEKKQLFNAWKVQRQKEERVRFFAVYHFFFL